ncbi:MAG: Pyrrolo-quinoline quinone, partial [Chlamydiales bacterium]|nr:Pyrrolo-quinoline quinone [Chlamydiales bacterium]
GAIIIIQITAGAHENDMITIDPLGTGPGQINVVGNYIKYGSIAIGTYSGAVKGASNLCIRLNSNATQAAINAAMQRISFSNEDVTAPIEDRTVTYTYSDNASTTHAATKIVNVISASASAPPASAVVAIPTITYIYNKLATALQYPRSFVLINKYIRSFFSFR